MNTIDMLPSSHHHHGVSIGIIISFLGCHHSHAAFVPSVPNNCRSSAAFDPPSLKCSRPSSGSNFGHYVGHHNIISLRSSNDNNEEKETEIFFDDFSGQSIGEAPGASLFTPDNIAEEEELPDFDDFSGQSIGEEAVSLSFTDKIAEEEELPDFDDTDENNPSSELISIPLPKTNPNEDLTGATLREFSFGPDIILSNYAGSLGFDQVTDWQYYATDERGERTEVSPRPMDPDQPARTRSSSGSVVRLFRGEVGGRLASKMRSRGLDPRVLIKEYSGEEAISLARAETKGLGRLQSAWLKTYLENNNKYDV